MPTMRDTMAEATTRPKVTGNRNGDLLAHRLAGGERRPKVPMDRSGEPVPVLDEQRIVEMQLGADPGDLGRRGAQAARQSDRRVARNERQQEEDGERDDEQHGNDAQQTP
jgi:hypothetical protein